MYPIKAAAIRMPKLENRTAMKHLPSLATATAAALLACLAAATGAEKCAPAPPESKSPSARNLPKLQEQFLSWKFGMFLHFNMATFANVEWANGHEDPAIFAPKQLDCGQWADAAKAAGMKYAVLTVKHTGGWCLWDSQCTDHDIAQFKNFRGGKGDLVKEFTDAFRKRGMKVGFYYCFPLYSKKWRDYWTLPLEGYRKGDCDSLSFIKNQFTELLTNYGEISVIWCDQSGTKNGGIKKGDWEKIKAHVHSLQPDCLVIANNQTNYALTDIYGYEFPYSHKLPPAQNKNPSEVCDKIQGGWFSRSKGSPAVASAKYIVDEMLVPLNANRSNILLNCGPDARGLLPDSVVERLKEVGKRWKEKGGK
jgi:alpha-L-fucosidase